MCLFWIKSTRMANINSKKRRLDSEVSHTSGLSVLSNDTRTTDLTNDSDERQGDYTDPNSSGPLINSRFNCTARNMTHSSQTSVRNIVPLRPRQISFNLDDDDEDDIEHVQCQRSAGPPYHRYDNRKPHMISRNRVRRFTESYIPNIEQETEDTRMLRSNTTAEFRRQQHFSQDHLTEQLVQEHDAKRRARIARREILMQGRSQSVNSLRESENIYTSLHDAPQNTIVKMPNSNSYLHPTTQIVPNTNNPIFPNRSERMNHPPDNISQNSSRYFHVDPASNHPPEPPIRCCLEKNYRKGFYLLLLLNIIFILLNVFGLPFAYVTIHEHWNNRDPQMCTKCDFTKAKDLETFGIEINDEGHCCLPQLDEFINGVNEKMESSRTLFKPSVNTVIKTPMLQMKSVSIIDNTLKWSANPEVKLHGNFKMSADYSHVEVPLSGYYYIYTRVMFKITDTQDSKGNKCKLGHEVRKSDNSLLGTSKYEKNCTNSINYSSHLEFVHFLSKDDKLYVKLLHIKAVHIPDQPSMFGMFLLSE